MADTPFFDFNLNIEDLIDDIEVVQDGVDDTKKSIEEMEKAAYRSVSRVIQIAQLGWGMIQGMLRASGGAISMTTRLVVSASFGAIKTLTPILYAAFHGGIASMNFMASMEALMGFAQLTTAIAALVAYESDQKKIALQLRGMNFMFSNMGMMLSSVSIT